MLVARLEAIFAGAVCAVVAAWFVTPITTEAVIRRRLADALLALDDVVVHAGAEAAEHARRLASFEHHMNELERAAPPVRWHRRLFAARVRPEHPAHWIDLAGGLRPHAHSVATHRNRGAVRRAIGASRRAIAQHGAPPEAAPEAVPVTVSLTALHETLRSDA
jgi:hypothetical protein